MSKSFNYRKAWDELAPAFALLTAAVLELFRDVTAAYTDTQQQGNLEMPWLPGFREKFELFSTDTLARAARAISETCSNCACHADCGRVVFVSDNEHAHETDADGRCWHPNDEQEAQS